MAWKSVLRRPRWWWHQWHHQRDKSKWTETWDSHKLQVPGFSYNWWGFKAWDTNQDSTDDISADKAETSLEWQGPFSQFQDTTDAFPCHIHLLTCLWIISPHSKEEHKPWKWDAVTRCKYASHTKTLLLARKSVSSMPRSSRPTGPHENLLTIVKRYWPS